MDNNCTRLFLDCLGIADMVGEFVNSLFTLALIVWAARNCYQLSRVDQDIVNEPQLQQSRKRKLWINKFIIVFLLVLLIEITYSYTSFIVDYDFQTGSLKCAPMWLSIGYKIVEIVCVNLLNCLIVQVGRLYWCAKRSYQLSRSIDLEERTGVPGIFRKAWEKVFKAAYLLAGICVVGSVVLLSFTHGEDNNEDYTIENAINFAMTFISISIFLFARIQSYSLIEGNRQISRSQLCCEKVYMGCVLFTCACRLITYCLAIFNVDPSQKFRHSRPDGFDYSFGHALYIWFLTVFVNLLPPFIFTLTFKKAAGAELDYESLNASLSQEDYHNVRI